MKRKCFWLILAFAAILVLQPACSSGGDTEEDGDQQTDGDQQPPGDGDETDGDEVFPDADVDTDGDMIVDGDLIMDGDMLIDGDMISDGDVELEPEMPPELMLSMSDCGTPPAGYGTVVGKVSTTNGQVLLDTAVNLDVYMAGSSPGGLAGNPNGWGNFYLCNMPAGVQYIIAAVSSDVSYGITRPPSYARVEVADGEVRRLEIIIKTVGQNYAFLDAAKNLAGGTFDLGAETSFTFDAEAFETLDGTAFTGAVTVQASVFDVTDPSQLQAFPGDFEGYDTDNEITVPILSLGFINVQLTDYDNDAGGDQENQVLKLKDGKSATMIFPVDTSNITEAETQIPLWFYDESTGAWVMEGTASIDHQTGKATAPVSHFSYWNVDKPITLTDCVRGKVKDTDGAIVEGVMVNAIGHGSGTSDATGEFCVNFYPRAEFSFDAGAWLSGVEVFATEPLTTFAGDRDGGQSCASDASQCYDLDDIVKHVEVDERNYDSLCLEVEFLRWFYPMDGDMDQPHRIDATDGDMDFDGTYEPYDIPFDGQLSLNDDSYQTIFRVSLDEATGSSICVEVPADSWFSVFMQGMDTTEGSYKGYSCWMARFNGAPIGGPIDRDRGEMIQTSTGTADCPGPGCDRLKMLCDEWDEGYYK